MVRTRTRAEQVVDAEFLSEVEGDERFIKRGDYGSNDANIIINDGYTISVNGETVNPLKVSMTSGQTTSAINEIEFNDGYGFHVVDLLNGKVRIDFGSAFKTLKVAGQPDLIAIGEDTLELIAGTNISFITDNTTDAKTLTFNATGGSSAVESQFFPVAKIGETTLATIYKNGWYSKTGNVVMVTLSIKPIKLGTGDITIDLPFTSKNAISLVQMLPANFVGVGGTETYGGSTYGGLTSSAEIQAIIEPNSDIMVFRRNNSAINLNESSIIQQPVITVTGTYIAE